MVSSMFGISSEWLTNDMKTKILQRTLTRVTVMAMCSIGTGSLMGNGRSKASRRNWTGRSMISLGLSIQSKQAMQLNRDCKERALQRNKGGLAGKLLIMARIADGRPCRPSNSGRQGDSMRNVHESQQVAILMRCPQLRAMVSCTDAVHGVSDLTWRI